MEILNLICYASVTLFTAVIFISAVLLFISSVVLCFSKKIKGNLFIKIGIAITIGCVCPWIFKLFMFFLTKTVGM